MKTQKIVLPDDIDPATPVGELSESDLLRIMGSVNGQLRWRGKSARAKSAHGKAMSAARMEGMTAEQRSEVARKAVMARWAKAKE